MGGGSGFWIGWWRWIPAFLGGASGWCGGTRTFCVGIFRGIRLVPGVIMIEALAQLAGVVFCSELGDSGGGRLLLTAVRSVKISGTAGPGEMLEIEVEITGKLGSLVQAAGAVSVEGRELMRGEVVLAGG